MQRTNLAQPPFSDTWPMDVVFAPRSSEALPLHWVATAAAFSGSGGLVSAEQLVELMRQHCEVAGWVPATQPATLVDHWAETGAVVSLDSPWGTRFPVFQFHLATASVVDGMAPLLAELRRVFDDAELALWFVTPNDWLGGAQPMVAMHHSFRAVANAARADRCLAGGV